MNLVIGLDLGTTNCKAVALSTKGEALAVASSAHEMHSPRPGWVEQDPCEVWRSALAALRRLVARTLPGPVVGLCLSGAMHSVFPVGRDGEPLAPAMTWADQRAACQAHSISNNPELGSHVLYMRTGCPPAPIYHPAKLRWWVEQAPDLVRQASHFATIKDYVLYRLSGYWVTDRGMASTMGLLDLRSAEWYLPALSMAGVSVEQLPALIWPSEIVGGLTAQAAHSIGLQQGQPVVAGTHDGGLANIGAGAAMHGDTVITVGTSGAVRQVVKEPVLDNEQRTWCYLLERDQWLAGGAINNGGLALEWIRERFYNDVAEQDGYALLLSEAAQIPPGAQGILLLPYFAGERSPHWDACARASVFGLGLQHTRAHIARSVLEGVAYCLADVWLALRSARAADDLCEDGLPLDAGTIVRLTGGITLSPLWSQIVADVLGVTLVSVEAADASAVGAAMLGHHALGLASLSQLTDKVERGSTYKPDPERHKLHVELHKRFQMMYQQAGKFDWIEYS